MKPHPHPHAGGTSLRAQEVVSLNPIGHEPSPPCTCRGHITQGKQQQGRRVLIIQVVASAYRQHGSGLCMGMDLCMRNNMVNMVNYLCPPPPTHTPLTPASPPPSFTPLTPASPPPPCARHGLMSFVRANIQQSLTYWWVLARGGCVLCLLGRGGQYSDGFTHRHHPPHMDPGYRV